MYKWCFFLFLFLIFSTSTLNLATATTLVNVKDFGSYGNDKMDDTQFIQNAIDFQSSKGGGVVYFNKGEYLIDSTKSITLRDNITLEFEQGAILKAIPNSAERYEIVKIHNVKNVNITGQVSIVGDRSEHTSSLGEWGVGISIRGAQDINIENVSISDSWGDGIYIGNTSKKNYSENIKINNSNFDNNRRQGITVVSVKKLEIINATITNTNGISPQSGIDIEPNNSTQFLKDIKIINLKTDNNQGTGFKIYLNNFRHNENPISIFVDSIKNIKDGIAVRSLKNIKGEIKIANYQYLSGTEVSMAPTFEPVTNTSENVIGMAPAGSFVTISVGSNGLGKAQTNAEGKFSVPIPVQEANAEMRIRVSDAFGNFVANKYTNVLNVKYTDFKISHWAYEEVIYLASRQVITGYPNESFQPQKNTTRAEAAKMLAIALDLPIEDVPSGYKDVSDKHWGKNYIAAVSKAGLFTGNPDGTFAPNDVLKRAEMAKVISIAYELQSSDKNHFSDVKASHWSKGYISGLFENGITTGYPDKTFRPGEPTTRAEYSVFLARAKNKKFR
ncbi:S-layer homology domain-containing protein [Planococcus donghaensis]|uniref:SLH domain-containing protein n=1 Tax=Planococcus donghaensis TaxID=414778 RepID=A0A1C7EEP3_9BACL|nr:S-layer homology domain-containing protein [Planococcus donghaensis]ANU22493.1 hypothetical protein BCM40_03605 [Planococcus donghaensis]